MRFAILGSVEVWAGDRRLALGGPRQLGLLSFLLLDRNRAVSRDSLMEALWGEDAGMGDKRLQTAIARLRNELERASAAGPSAAAICLRSSPRANDSAHASQRLYAMPAARRLPRRGSSLVSCS
jgi:DNA-binding SARP family transcriptional activator